MKHSPRNPHFMKNFLLNTVCFLTVCSAAHSQGYHLGLAVSPNYSFSDARELSHTANGGQVHFGYGFIFDALFTETYAIGTGVNIFYNGGRVLYFEDVATSEGTMIHRVELENKQQYVEVPLTFKMRTKEIGYSTFYGQFGVGLGLNVRSEGMRRSSSFAVTDSLGQWSFIQEGASDPARVSLVDQTLLFRPSMIIGFGFERRFTGTTALVVGLRYNMALRNQYQLFPVYKTQTGDEVMFEFNEILGAEQPEQVEMSGKTGQIELCVGIMF